jgi:hypothetical protein
MTDGAIDKLITSGYGDGNYSNAYESLDFDAATSHRQGFNEEAYRTGFILGFWSSYELHEIESRWRSIYDEAYHSATGRRALELGYSDSKEDAYKKEAEDGKSD